MKKGQVSIETVIIAAVLLGLLLITSLFMTQKNIETNSITAGKRNSITCQKISAIITEFSSGKDYSEAKIFGIEKDIRIEKGSILIEQDGGGKTSCAYSGSALFEQSKGSYLPDADGFDLAKEKMGAMAIYKVKKVGYGVVFCDYAETWC